MMTMIDALGDKDSTTDDIPKTRISISIERRFEQQEAQRPGNGVTMNYRGAENGARRFSATDRYLLHQLANVYQESITPCIIDASSGRTPDRILFAKKVEEYLFFRNEETIVINLYGYFLDQSCFGIILWITNET